MEKRTSGAEECMVQLVDCLKDQGQLDAMGFLKGRNWSLWGMKNFGKNLWSYLKILVQMDAKIFKWVEGLLRFEEVKVEACGNLDKLKFIKRGYL